MNISYNSLSECLNLVADQFTSLTELFNPLVSRAKLLANPLFRSDVMANDKLKKWGKGVLQKTKAMATLLSPPTEQDRSSSGSTGLPQSPRIQSSDEDMMIAKPTSRGKFSPEISLTRQQSSNFGDASPDDGKHGNKGFFSRIFKSKKKDVSRERALSPRGSAPPSSSATVPATRCWVPRGRTCFPRGVSTRFRRVGWTRCRCSVVAARAGVSAV